MNRRAFFRLVAGAAAWVQTKHVAWAFPHARDQGVLRLGDTERICSVLTEIYGPGIMKDLNHRSPLLRIADDDYIVQAANSAVTDILDTSYPWSMSQSERDRYNKMVEGDDRYKLYGLDAGFDDVPLTYRPGEYLGIDRGNYEKLLRKGERE